MFSEKRAPISSTLSLTVPSPHLAASSSSRVLTPLSTSACMISSAASTNLGDLPTKSVSEFSSTITPACPSAVSRTFAITRPLAVERSSRLARDFLPAKRIAFTAASLSPFASSSAFLTSIRPAPVNSRSSLMSCIEIAISMFLSLTILSGLFRLFCFGGGCRLFGFLFFALFALCGTF